jgi:hypothetical protein
MREHIDVDCAPYLEDCAQLGQADYSERARRECRAYIAQLRRTVGQEPPGASLAIRTNPHDFGDYLSVVCQYDPAVEAAVEYAFNCESHAPAEWDEAARAELNSSSRERS